MAKSFGTGSKANLLFFLILNLFSLLSAPIFADEGKAESLVSEDGYTINYNTVSILEYIRFASKICKVNFIYEEADLNFTITVVSDEPITPQNVMATLIQVLRIHGLTLLEQGNNLVIHRSANVAQIATLVTENGQGGLSPIVTRIFRIKNAKPESIASIIRPMISSSAILETSPETRQLILTDITANVNKVAALIENIDSPHTLLEIKTFEAIHNKPALLVELATQIMAPIAQGNPLILVPQPMANVIFVVSTPELSEKTLAVFKSLDTPPKQEILDASGLSPAERAALSGQSFFLYTLKYASHEKTEAALKQIASHLSKPGEEDLIETIQTMKWIEPSQSFLFQGSDASLARVKELLKNFDTPEEGTKKPSYYIYKVQNTTGDEIEDDLDSLVKNFASSGLKDAKIIDVIQKMRYVKETNSLLLSGDPQAIEEVKKLIAEYDYPRKPKGPMKTSFYMYKPQHIRAQEIEKSLRDIATNLKKADLADPTLLQSIDSAKYVETTNSLIFTGPPETLKKIEALIKDIDVAPSKHAPIQHVGKTTFLLYKLKNASGSQVMDALKAMSSDLKKSKTSDKEFLAALSSMKYVKDTNSILFTGTEESLIKVQALVEKFDVTGLAAPAKAAEPLPGVGNSNFFVYKPQSLSGPDLEKIVDDFAENLKMSGLSDPELFSAISSMRWVEKTQSMIFTGTPKALEQLKELLKGFDIPSNLPEGTTPGGPLEPTIQAIDNTSFLVYKLQFHKGDEIQGALRQIAKDLILSNAPVNQNLLNSINSIQWLEVTNSLLCSGDQETLTRLRELIKNLDIPLKQVFIEMLVIQTNLTNALTFGLEWGGNYKYRNKFGGSMFNTLPPTTSGACAPDTFVNSLSNLVPPSPPTPVGNIPPGCGFDLGVIGEVINHGGETFLTLGSLLSALQTDDETSVIMTPKIITQDGRTSSIFVGENIPFVGSFVSNTTNSTINTSNIEYRDIGLSLTITPVLGNSDIVTLDINLDRSQTVGNIDTTITNNTTANGITTSKTSMQTTVHVPDNNFLILSGMVNNSNAKTKSGIPCLGGLPVIGAAFSKQGDTLSNSNIVIFIRPHIINSLDDMRRITADQEEYFRDQAGTPFLERNFDEGMELIKTIDDE